MGAPRISVGLALVDGEGDQSSGGFERMGVIVFETLNATLSDGGNYKKYGFQGSSGHFLELRCPNLWGARGSEFKSRRCDQYLSASSNLIGSAFEWLALCCAEPVLNGSSPANGGKSMAGAGAVSAVRSSRGSRRSDP